MRPSFDFYVFTETLELHPVKGISGFLLIQHSQQIALFQSKGKNVSTKYSFNF